MALPRPQATGATPTCVNSATCIKAPIEQATHSAAGAPSQHIPRVAHLQAGVHASAPRLGTKQLVTFGTPTVAPQDPRHAVSAIMQSRSAYHILLPWNS